jgi:hypothetical protein
LGRLTTHGKSKSRSYRAWASMKTRCYNTKNHAFKYYGRRGIVVCDEWMDFETFYRDMGEPPPKFSLERNDVNGPYCKENCIWATAKTQARNRTNNNIVTIHNESKTLSQWAEETHIKWDTLHKRILNGCLEENLLSKPRNYGRKSTK